VLAEVRVHFGEHAARLGERRVDLERARELGARRRALTGEPQRGAEQEVGLGPVGAHVDRGAQRLHRLVELVVGQVDLGLHEQAARVGGLGGEHAVDELAPSASRSGAESR
jgi:hypothetical protein